MPTPVLIPGLTEDHNGVQWFNTEDGVSLRAEISYVLGTDYVHLVNADGSSVYLEVNEAQFLANLLHTAAADALLAACLGDA